MTKKTGTTTPAEPEKTFFGLAEHSFFAKCPQIQPQILDIKNVDNMQRVNLKLEVEMTPGTVLGSQYFDSGFMHPVPVEQTGTQESLAGVEAEPPEYRAQIGGEKKIGHTEKDWAILIKEKENDPELFAELIRLLDYENTEVQVIRLHPLSGVSLNTIKPDDDKHTKTPRALFAFMVKGLPARIAGAEWLLNRINFKVVNLNEEEVNIENAHARAKKGATGQGDTEETTGNPAEHGDLSAMPGMEDHQKNVEALIDAVDQKAWLKLEENAGGGEEFHMSEADVEGVFLARVEEHGPLDLEKCASEHAPPHFVKAAQASTDPKHRFCYLMLATYLELTAEKPGKTIAVPAKTQQNESN